MEIELDKCPYCGNDDSFYVKTRISGLADYHYSFDGVSEAYNGHIHDTLTYKDYKTKYCGECHKKLPNK